MSKLTQDEIRELISTKEKQEDIFKHSQEAQSDNTQELFLKIRDDFLKYAIEESIARGYALDRYDKWYCIAKAIDKNYTLSFPYIDIADMVGRLSFRTNIKFEAIMFLEEYNVSLLENNTNNLLDKNGFNTFCFKSTTSKQALLGYPEIKHSECLSETKPFDSECETKGVGVFLIILIVGVVLGWILK